MGLGSCACYQKGLPRSYVLTQPLIATLQNKKANLLRAMNASAVDAREANDAAMWSKREGREFHSTV